MRIASGPSFRKVDNQLNKEPGGGAGFATGATLREIIRLGFFFAVASDTGFASTGGGVLFI